MGLIESDAFNECGFYFFEMSEDWGCWLQFFYNQDKFCNPELIVEPYEGSVRAIRLPDVQSTATMSEAYRKRQTDELLQGRSVPDLPVKLLGGLIEALISLHSRRWTESEIRRKEWL